MSVNKKLKISSFGLLLILFCSIAVFAQTSVFTYQGKLTDTSAAANGQYDFTFKLFDTDSNGTQIGTDVFLDNVPVSGGIFTVNLNFGASSFSNGAARFLEISVRTGASTGAFTTLAPRQQITSAPFAIQTLKATSADALSSSCALCVTDAQIQTIDGNKVTGTVSSANTANNISGIVPITNGGTGSSTKNFVDLSTNQTNIGGNKTFNSAVTFNQSVTIDQSLNVSGNVTADQLSGEGSGITNIYGSSLVDGTVTKSKLDYGATGDYDLQLVATLRWDLLGPKAFPVGIQPQAIAFDGANIWVANNLNSTVTKLRASDGALLGTFPCSPFPIGIAFDGANIWTVGGGNASRISKLRASDGANLGNFSVGIASTRVAFDGANVWITDISSSIVRKLRASDGLSLGSFTVGSNPAGIAFDGANIWVANTFSNNVTKLRASDGSILGTFAIGASPAGIAFDGTNIWVRHFNNVSKLRASDGAILGVFPVAGTSSGIAFDGSNIWVSSGGTVVTKLRASDGDNLGIFTISSDPGSQANGIVFDGKHIWVTNPINAPNTNGTVIKLPASQ